MAVHFEVLISVKTATFFEEAEPWVLESLDGSDSSLRVLVHDQREQVLTLWRDMTHIHVSFDIKFFLYNILEYLLSGFTRKRQFTGESNVHDDSEGPHVTGKTEPTANDLWSDVKWTTTAE